METRIVHTFTRNGRAMRIIHDGYGFELQVAGEFSGEWFDFSGKYMSQQGIVSVLCGEIDALVHPPVADEDVLDPNDSIYQNDYA